MFKALGPHLFLQELDIQQIPELFNDRDRKEYKLGALQASQSYFIPAVFADKFTYYTFPRACSQGADCKQLCWNDTPGINSPPGVENTIGRNSKSPVVFSAISFQLGILMM